ncbi:hypothetical protein ABRZ08_13085 [Castellaniella ginsengisoli]|uniref:Uncharacterized protein n=1 Tax=Castellaniella ginsengisoli TaxID=546114 RepID=A0AB39FZM3_9BURK
MTFNRTEYVAARRSAKANVARALTAAGERSFAHERIDVLRARAVRLLGDQLQGEPTIDYFNRVAGLQPRAKSETTGQRVPARTHEPLRAKAWTPPRHLRAAEIDALPRPVSMSGRVTNYVGFEERK